YCLLIVCLCNCLTVSAQNWLWGKQGCTLDATPGVNMIAKNIATNKTGNVYETGGFTSKVNFGTDTLTSTFFGDVFLAKYDQNGNFLWARQSKSDSGAFAISVASDDSDNAYVTGVVGDTGAMLTVMADTAIFGTDTLRNNRTVF